MDDSPQTRTGPGKRERLVQSAVALMHERGVQATTIADVAEAAGVPAGNVYYYFKTKDELIGAAVEAHAGLVQSILGELDHEPTPAARLKAFILMLVSQSGLAAQYGCPQGTLCSELDKRGDDGLARDASKLIQIPIDWAEGQFAAMGRADAADLAVALIASYQGISLLTNTFREPQMMTREGDRLTRWIDSLASDPARLS